MVVSSFLPQSLSLLILLLSSPSPTFSIRATRNDQNLLPSSTLNFPKKQAEKLIRELNLFPEHDININTGNNSAAAAAAAATSVVEKRLNLPVLGDSGATVQDLGHHAGYFRLPNTKAARYIIV